ncbi:MAG: hypothetical protein ACE5OS_14875 [Anaerolineae bacterium]
MDRQRSGWCTIYMTLERWEYIIAKHPELDGHLDDVLTTLRFGRRKQDRRDPQTYTYRHRCERLRPPYNHIVVAVSFRWQHLLDGTTVPNNFVVSAWGKYVSPKR